MINHTDKLGLAYLLAVGGSKKSLTERLKQVDDDLKSMVPKKKSTGKQVNGRRRAFVNGKWQEVALYDDDSEELLSETVIEPEEDDD